LLFQYYLELPINCNMKVILYNRAWRLRVELPINSNMNVKYGTKHGV